MKRVGSFLVLVWLILSIAGGAGTFFLVRETIFEIREAGGLKYIIMPLWDVDAVRMETNHAE